MEFETLAHAELTALARRLADAAAADRASAVEEAASRAQSEAEAELSRLRGELAASLERAREEAAAEVGRVQAEAAAQIDMVRTEAQVLIDQARSATQSTIEQTRNETQVEIERVRADALAEQARLLTDKEATVDRIQREADARLRDLRAEHEAALLAARAEAEGDGSRLKADLIAETARIREMADAAIAEAQLAAAADIAQARAAADMNAARAQAAETELVAIRAAASAATKTNSTFGAMIEKLRDRQTQLAAENERLAAENAAYTYERQDLLEKSAKGGANTSMAPLATTFERMAAAGTVDEVLASAAAGLAGGLARVAVFSVRDNRLLPGFHRGFDSNSGLDKVVIPLGVDSFMSTAAHIHDLQVLRGPAQTSAAPFGGSPQLVLTATMAVRGETLAVLYCDDSGRPLEGQQSDDQLAQVRIVLAYTALRLDQLTTELKAAAELKAYAQMLVDEAEYVYQADVAAKKPDAERTNRLAENLRCARQIYRQRVTLEGPAAAALLEEVLRETIEKKAATTFGRELQKAVAGSASKPADQRAAQAS